MKETDFARYLTQFLSTYLPRQVGSKRNTQLAYRDSFSLFLRYCRDQENLSPEKLTIAKVDRELILRFLQWLEDERNCKAATRNQRLAAIHSFFSFLIGGRTTVYAAKSENPGYPDEKNGQASAHVSSSG